jgi:hypothetical protein
MTTNRVGNLILAALCVLTLLVLVIGSVRGAQANLRSDHAVRCEEDNPCWDFPPWTTSTVGGER